MNIQKTPIALHLSRAIGKPEPSTFVEKFCGLTDWVCTRDDPPPMIGWWKTYAPGTKPQRRYWDGLYWSAPMYEWMTPEHCVDQRLTRAFDSDGVIWCGLKRPHLAGYFDPIIVTARTHRISQLKAGK